MSAFFDYIRRSERSAVNDFLTYIGYPYPEDIIREDNPLWLLGVPPYCAETHFFVVDLFLKLVRESKWSEQDKRVWIDRYVLKTPTKDVAKKIKRKPVWVHAHFYRCKQKLAKKVKVWWDKRSADNLEETLPKVFKKYINERYIDIK